MKILQCGLDEYSASLRGKYIISLLRVSPHPTLGSSGGRAVPVTSIPRQTRFMLSGVWFDLSPDGTLLVYDPAKSRWTNKHDFIVNDRKPKPINPLR